MIGKLDRWQQTVLFPMRAEREMSEKPDFMERRKFDRYPLMLDAEAVLPGERCDAVLLDISAGGAKFRFVAELSVRPEPGIPISIHVEPFGGFYGDVMWVDGDYIGMEFDERHKAIASLVHEMVAQSRESVFPPLD